jgi:Spy/CpxP family protein refolding chaperone
MMKLVRSIAFSLSVGCVSVVAVACGGTVEHSPQTSASAATKAPIGTNTHGMVKLVGDALGEVPLRADQRAEIEKLAADAETRHAPTAEGRKELMLAFADQVEKGAIDKTALQPKIDKVTTDFEKVRADDRAALIKLHTILDGEQRNVFVDALEKQMKSKHGERGDHMRGGFGKMKQLAEDLKLTDAQKSQIKDAFHDLHKEGKQHHARGPHQNRGDVQNTAPNEWRGGPHHGRKAIEAFREESFDLDKVAPQQDIKPMARFGTDRMSAMAEKLLPILTPEQRKIAAEKIRAMAAGGDSSLLVH